MPKIPQPLWPLPGDTPHLKLKVKVRKGGGFTVDFGGGVMLTEKFLEDAVNYGMDEIREMSRETEYTQRREKLAEFLCDLVYGNGAWERAQWNADDDLMLNYRLDADDIIKANPHLLSLGERERLEHIIPELALGASQ